MLKIKIRQNERCKICKSTEKLISHHVSYFPEKKIIVCRSCHTKISHYDKYKKFRPDKKEVTRFYSYARNYIRLNFTLPEDTLKKLQKISKEEQRSISNMISHLVEQYKKPS